MFLAIYDLTDVTALLTLQFVDEWVDNITNDGRDYYNTINLKPKPK